MRNPRAPKLVKGQRVKVGCLTGTVANPRPRFVARLDRESRTHWPRIAVVIDGHEKACYPALDTCEPIPRPFDRFIRIRNPGDKRAKIVPKSIVEERCECVLPRLGVNLVCGDCDGTGRVFREGGVDA